MKTISGNRCALCNQLLETKTPVLVVGMHYTLHMKCWREECLHMTSKQMEEYIKRRIEGRNVKQ